MNILDLLMKLWKQLTSRQLHGLVGEKFPAVSTSVNTAKRAHQGWDSKKTGTVQ